ncbi:MAG: transglutaminase family protein [Hyphomicrobiales bacterium]|nr:transglutaminase family protein [Hyphomicrobiales bacterium]
MRIVVHHEIVQAFAYPLKSAIEVLRLRPKDFESQHVAAWSVDVDTDCALREGRDAFGNFTQTLDCEGPISKIVIAAHGEIDTFDTAGMLRGGEPERFPVDVFLRDSDLTVADEALRAFAQSAVKGSKTSLDRPHFLMRAVSEAVKFAADEAPVAASAAFRREKGCAQDHAHIFIAGARALGIPARCVSGYLAPETSGEPAMPHAWAEAHVEGIGWIGFDPTICLCMHDGHVRVAAALDYQGCAPLRLPPMTMATTTETLRVRSEQAGRQQQG